MLTKKQLILLDEYISEKKQLCSTEVETLKLFRFETEIRIAEEIKKLLNEDKVSLKAISLVNHEFITKYYPMYKNYGLDEELVIITAILCDKNIPFEIEGITANDIEKYQQWIKEDDKHFPYEKTKKILDYMRDVTVNLNVRDRRKILKRVDFPVMVLFVLYCLERGFSDYKFVSQFFWEFFSQPNSDYLDLRTKETRTLCNIHKRFDIVQKNFQIFGE